MTQNIKTYRFYFYANTYDLEWNDYEYYTSDLIIGVSQPLFSERECLICVARQENLLTEEHLVDMMTSAFIEQMLLENNIYVQFLEGE